MDQAVINQRLAICGVEPAMLARLQRYQGFLDENAEHLVEDIIANVVRMVGDQDSALASNAAEKARIDAAHFRTICRGALGEDYLKSLQVTHVIALKTGSGARGRASTALGLAQALFEEIGRQRWSRKETILDCTAVLKVFIADIILAIMMDQSNASSEYERRRSSLEEVTTFLSEHSTTMADSMQAISASLSRHTGETTHNADISHAAAENLHEVATLHQTLAREAAASAAELSVSMGSIQDGSRQSAEIARQAVLDSQAVSQSLDRLQETIAAIDDFAGIISNVASQTNLLALNATIEAARAGESGRGFAVVAQEIKRLASQVEASSASITQRVSAIRNSLDETNIGVRAVDAKIETMDTFVRSILESVDAQKEKTAGIANHAEHTADQMKESADLAIKVRDSMQATIESMRGMQAMVAQLVEKSNSFDAATQKTTELLTTVR